MPFEFFPNTNFHDLNLDYILEKAQKIDDNLRDSQASADAAKASEEAAAASEAAAQLSEEAAAASEAAAKDYADHIADPVSGLVTEWLADNITQETGYVLDTSLTSPAAAAPAKTVGDMFARTLIYRGAAAATDYSNLISHVVTPGIYYIRGSGSDTYNDRPEGINAASAAIMMVNQYGSALVYQSFYAGTGNIVRRLVNKNTFDPYTTDLICDSFGWFVQSEITNTQSQISQLASTVADTDALTQIYRGTANPDVYGNLISHIVTPGSHYVRGSGSATYNDRPADLSSASAGILIVDLYGNTLVRQTYYNGLGDVRHRLVNKNTYEPFTTDLPVDANGWFMQRDLSKLYNAFRWYSKRLVCFGDSRTWYDGKAYTDTTKPEWTGNTCYGYQQEIASLCGMTLINQGVNGETSTEICSRIRAYNFANVDAAFLEGGVNDFIRASSITIGELQQIGSTFDTSTVYGAWQSAVEYILTNYPQVKIYMDIPAIAWSGSNVFPYDIAKIKGEVAALYNIPYLDLYKTAGINQVNRDYYYADNVASTGWRLHFNDYGNKLVGAIIAEFINTH